MITLITFFYLISLPTHSFPKDSKLPQEIKNFYQDLNFVNLHSTEKERKFIRYLIGPKPIFVTPWTHDLMEKDPKKKLLKQKRLKDVLKKLVKLNNKIWNTDPGIYWDTWRNGPEYNSYYDYYEIEKVEYDQDIIKIYTDSYNILPVHNKYFVANYGTEKNDSEKNNSKEFFKLIKKEKTYSKPYKEIHFWVKFDDVWMIGDKSILLLGQSKLSL